MLHSCLGVRRRMVASSGVCSSRRETYRANSAQSAPRRVRSAASWVEYPATLSMKKGRGTRPLSSRLTSQSDSAVPAASPAPGSGRGGGGATGSGASASSPGGGGPSCSTMRRRVSMGVRTISTASSRLRLSWW